MENMGSTGSTGNGGIVKDWFGELFEIKAVKGDLVVLRSLKGGKKLLTRQAIIDFFYKKIA